LHLIGDLFESLKSFKWEPRRQADTQTTMDRNDEANGRFSQFCERA